MARFTVEIALNECNLRFFNEIFVLRMNEILRMKFLFTNFGCHKIVFKLLFFVNLFIKT